MRIAEIYSADGLGLKQDYSLVRDLFTQASELFSAARRGRLAAKYFKLGEGTYWNCNRT